MSARITIADQIEGVDYARRRLMAELAHGLALMDGAEMAEARQALGRINGALTTLHWIAADREGALALFVGSSFPPPPAAPASDDDGA
jgi:hypothetical protein